MLAFDQENASEIQRRILNQYLLLKSLGVQAMEEAAPAMCTYLTEISPNNGVKRFVCKVCQRSYKNKRHLYRHEKEECITVEPKFKCDICGNMFRRKYHLSRHMATKHHENFAINMSQQLLKQ